MTSTDPDGIVALQVPNHVQVPLLNQSRSDISNRPNPPIQIQDDIQISSILEEKSIQQGQGQRLFPIFGDFGLSIFSINYALYLEFSYTIIQILFRLLLLGIFFNTMEYIMRIKVFSIIFLTDVQIERYCSGCTDQKDFLLCKVDMTFLTECKKAIIIAFYCVMASLLTLIFQTLQRKKQETMMINNPELYDFNWTQDLFSILIENIPPGATENELKTFFNHLEPLKKINGEVKEIIFVQDISKCNEILKRITQVENDEKLDLDKKQQRIQELKNQFSCEESRLPLHDGKAIVSFDSLRTRSVALKLFCHSKWNFLEILFRGYKTQTAFKNSYLTSKRLPEPQNLNFENLCCSKLDQSIREIFAFVFKIILMMITTAFVFPDDIFYTLRDSLLNLEIPYWKKKFEDALNNPSDSAASNSDIYATLFQSYYFSFTLLLLQILQDFLFQAVEKLTKRTKKTDSEEHWLNHSIYSSFFLYLIIQGLAMVRHTWEGATDLAHSTINLYCLKHLIIKLGGFCFCYRKTNHPKFNDCEGIYYSIRNAIALKVFNIDMTAKTFQFRFFREASRVFPLIAMNFAFMLSGSHITTNLISTIPTTIPITIFTIYIGALCDKYVLINQPEPCKLNSARFMIKLFRFLRVDHFAFWFGALIWMVSTTIHSASFSFVLEYYLPFQSTFKSELLGSAYDVRMIAWYALLVIIGLYLCYLAIWPFSESLEKKYDFYFEQNRRLVPYDTVASDFIHTYQNSISSGLQSQNQKSSMTL